MVFALSELQKNISKHFDTCHLEKFKSMNVYTPYVFELEPNQREALVQKNGFAPRYFYIYKTLKDFNDAGPHWNIVLQFSESEFEIPVDLLIPDNQSYEAQLVQGWELNNPCFPDLAKLNK